MSEGEFLTTLHASQRDELMIERGQLWDHAAVLNDAGISTLGRAERFAYILQQLRRNSRQLRLLRIHESPGEDDE